MQNRFALLTFGAPGDLLRASTDPDGRPCSWAQLLGLDDDRFVIQAVTTLPVGEDYQRQCPEAFRLLVTFRVADPPRHLAQALADNRALAESEIGGRMAQALWSTPPEGAPEPPTEWERQGR